MSDENTKEFEEKKMDMEASMNEVTIESDGREEDRKSVV